MVSGQGGFKSTLDKVARVTKVRDPFGPGKEKIIRVKTLFSRDERGYKTFPLTPGPPEMEDILGPNTIFILANIPSYIYLPFYAVWSVN